MSTQHVYIVWKEYKTKALNDPRFIDLSTKSQRGAKTKLTYAIQDSIEIILQDYANKMRYSSNEMMTEHLKELGYDISVSSVICANILEGYGCKNLHTTPEAFPYRQAEAFPHVLGKDGIFDTIKAKMTWLNPKAIIIQHGGAAPHNGNGNRDCFNVTGKEDGWNISFETQPPAQSPVTNILDLGFFNNLKKRASREHATAYNIEEMMIAVQKAYDEYDSDTLERIWGHQFAVYRLSLKYNGGNQFQAQHTGHKKSEEWIWYRKVT